MLAANKSFEKPLLKDAGNSKLVFRLFSETGRSRLEIAETETLASLYSAVRKHKNLEPDAVFDIYANEVNSKNRIPSLNDPITSFRHMLPNGAALHLQLAKSETILQKSEPSTKAVPPAVDSSVELSEKVATTEEKATQETTDNTSKTPKFVAFDKFLQDRTYNISDLALLQDYRPVRMQKGAPIKLPSSVTLKHQPYRHVDHIEFVNVTELNNFVNHWRHDLDMLNQRFGWLIGYYVEDDFYPQGIRAVVEAIYEPPQLPEADRVSLAYDSMFETVVNLSDMLGLSVIGKVTTHLPRDILLTPDEVIESATFQLDNLKKAPKHYTGYPVSPFVTVTVSLDSSNGDVSLNALMISDLRCTYLMAEFGPIVPYFDRGSLW